MSVHSSPSQNRPRRAATAKTAHNPTSFIKSRKGARRMGRKQ